MPKVETGQGTVERGVEAQRTFGWNMSKELSGIIGGVKDEGTLEPIGSL